VGNIGHGEPLIHASEAIKPEENLGRTIRDFFTGRFNSQHERWSFIHHQDLQYHLLYNLCKQVFETPNRFHDAASGIARHLHQQSRHPMIKAGELFVTLFREVELDGRRIKVIGIFKTETRTPFFDVVQEEGDLVLGYQEGIELSKFEKGALILDTGREQGYQLALSDRQSKAEESQYWTESFLTAEPCNDSFQKTRQVMNRTKDFIQFGVVESLDFSKAEAIDLMNRTAEYFKSNEQFSKSNFEEEVLQEKPLIDHFRTFTERDQSEGFGFWEDGFELSAQAVKKQQKVFKSVLKLDRNFHVYIHGDKSMIERGMEPDGRKFYKLYFEEEE
jgi:hypothetical protein